MNQDADEAESGTRSRAFWLRLMDNAFRRKWLFVLPVVLLTSLGVVQAGKSVPQYRSTGVLSAASNPLVIDQSVRGANFEVYESAAEGTSRIINERLRTNAFTGEVARRAGLQDALEVGLITLDTVRNSVWAEPGGNSLLRVNASWGDPQSSFQLVDAAIGTYQDYLADTVARDSSEAEEYYRNLRESATVELDAAEDELAELLDTLPVLEEDDERPIEDALRIENLNDRIEAAGSKVLSAQENIDSAELAVIQSRSEAGRSLQVIDEPRVPVQPQATLMTKIQLVIGMFLLGVLVGAAAILVTTALDRSVITARELAALPGVALVSTVPPIGAGPSRKKRKKRGAAKRPPPRVQPADESDEFTAPGDDASGEAGSSDERPRDENSDDDLSDEDLSDDAESGDHRVNAS